MMVKHMYESTAKCGAVACDLCGCQTSCLSEAPQIYQLKVRLLGISPMIWRRVRVLDSTTLRELHGSLQVAMGWEDLHLYAFEIDAVPSGALACLWQVRMSPSGISGFVRGVGFQQFSLIDFLL